MIGTVIRYEVENAVKERQVITSFRGQYAFLSNMYEAPFSVNGVFYRCVESAFQATKLEDREKRGPMFSSLSGSDAKKLGRKIELRKDWNDIRVPVMKRLVELKFKQNPELMQKLIDTGSLTIVECNDWGDSFWGVCNGRGENQLGIILMRLRKENTK